MSRILPTPDDLMAVSELLSQAMEIHRTLLDGIVNAVISLDTNWSSEVHNAFMESFVKNMKLGHKFQVNMDETADFLKQYALAMKAIDLSEDI